MIHLVGALILGIGAGYGGLVPENVLAKIDVLIIWTLALLLFAVGVGLGRDREGIRALLNLGPQILLLPISVAIGSIAAAGIVGLIFGQTWNEGAAIGAGFGWYSLSGIMITNLHSARLGTLAFLSNVMRETVGIIILPGVNRYLGDMATVAPGGATAMDVSLPVIIEVAGEEMGLVAFASGFILTLLVPVLVPLLLS
ncbi:MAG: lysine exporter LysO family protein [bacterium]|jgi:uncharacterized membrane protein YbjE (DUF340 family)